jgi:hypothetical protein
MSFGPSTKPSSDNLVDLSSNLPQAQLHGHTLSFNSAIAAGSIVQVGPYDISISADKKSLQVAGQGLMFFASRKQALQVPFEGQVELVERSQSIDGVQMEIGRVADKLLMIAFRREEPGPVAKLLIKQSSEGILFQLDSRFGGWLQCDNFVTLVENYRR